MNCNCNCGSKNPCCRPVDFLAGYEITTGSPLQTGRVYVPSQAYADCAGAEQTLRGGTYFEELRSPYLPCQN